MLKDLRPDKNRAYLYIKTNKKQKKTDIVTPYEKSKMKRLVLYHLGISFLPLSASRIERNISKKEYSGARPNYVYELLKILAPESDIFPNTLLLKHSDFFNKDNSMRTLNEEIKEKLLKKIKLKIFGSYALYLNWDNIDDYEDFKIQNKNTKEVTIEGKNKNKSVKIFLDSNASELHNIAKLYLNGMEVPILKIRKKGTVNIYTVEPYSNINSRYYLDRISKSCPLRNMFDSKLSVNDRDNDQTYSPSKEEELGYVLNLRGLLQYILLCKETKFSYRQINKVIENLSKIDNYWKIENELAPSDIIGITYVDSKDINKIDLVNHKVKERFPFLSFYYRYKNHLPQNYAANVLIKIAEELANRLETMSIAELKYRTTYEFFTKIENYFWESGPIVWQPKIDDRRQISDDIFSLLEDFQNEIRYYLELKKKIEFVKYTKLTEHHAENNFRNKLKRMILRYIDENSKPVVSIKEILHPTKPDTTPIELTGREISVIQEICESSEFGYITNKGFFLFKQIEIEKIKGHLESMMPLEMAKKIIYNHGISNETAIMDVILLSGFKALRGIGKIQKI